MIGSVSPALLAMSTNVAGNSFELFSYALAGGRSRRATAEATGGMNESNTSATVSTAVASETHMIGR